jgi:uncharacterized protein
LLTSTDPNRPKRSIDAMPVRAVFDTNVYISIFAFPERPMAALWDLVITGEIDLFVSPPIMGEFRAIIQSKFHFGQEETRVFADRILNSATLVDPSQKVEVVKGHEEDNRILECALEAQAEFLVSGDRRHILPLKRFRDIEIVTPSDFLKTLSTH